ncbi:MAG: DUF389 domain-containing protein [Acidobacteria bacterium]|nr:DUF389 domain-containing protein [Acidobacteriota bacterium]
MSKSTHESAAGSEPANEPLTQSDHRRGADVAPASSPRDSSDGTRSRVRRLSAVGSLLGNLIHSKTWDDDERTRILGELFFEGPEWRPFLSRFVVLTVLSTTLAAFGLIANSAAVVIGAMLIAPLMTPILATAASLVHGQIDRLAVSLLVLTGGTLLAIAAGWAVSWLTAATLTAEELTPELLSRATPSLLDLGVAIAAGLAAGYIVTNSQAGSSLPGVAIAVALVPPLGTAGISLELGATAEAEGALLLFATNLVVIILSAMIVMLASGFVPSDIRIMVRGRVNLGLFVATLGVIGVAIPLTAYTLDVFADQHFTREVISQVREWDPSGRIVELSADIGASRATVEIVMASSQEPVPAWRLAELLAAESDLPVDVRVQYRIENRDEATAD